MRILVTGGNGFMGAWIARRLLARGVAVRVFDTTTDDRLVRAVAGAGAAAVEQHPGDVADGEQVLRAAEGCDGIVHLAGVLTPACRADPVRGARITLIGTLNLFEAARRLGLPRLVYTSSAGVFGPDDPRHPWPTTQYGAFKLACEGSARAYWLDAGIASIGFRPFVVYGPGRETGISAGPSLACRAAARSEPYTIPFTGRTGLVYVDDVAAAYEQAVLGTPAGGAHVVNLTGVPATVEETIAAIRAVVPGAVLDAEGPPLPIAADLDDGGLAALLPGLPHTGLAEGIARTVAFYMGRSDG